MVQQTLILGKQPHIVVSTGPFLFYFSCVAQEAVILVKHGGWCLHAKRGDLIYLNKKTGNCFLIVFLHGC